MNNDNVSILLIEDDLGDAEMIIRSLKKTGMGEKIVHLEDGALAIDYIFGKGEFSKNGAHLPQVIILDLSMPKVNGLDVLKEIRKEKRTRLIPVVVFTSSKEDSDLKKCYELGVNSYIVKPVEYREFSRTIALVGQYWLELNQLAE